MGRTNRTIFSSLVCQVFALELLFSTNTSEPNIILGLGFLRKFQQYRRLPQEAAGGGSGHHLEEELDRLTGKIDNLLCKIEGQDQEAARGQEEECLVCGSNRACMMTLPCSHQVSEKYL